jgi:hypothetical protein
MSGVYVERCRFRRDSAQDRYLNDILQRSVKCLKSLQMTRFRNAKAWQNAFAGLLIAHLLIVVALVASPQLHQLLHHDADHSDHECAVTVMISGGTDGSSGPPVFEADAMLPAASGFSQTMHSNDIVSLFLSVHVFEHAPPFA